MLASSRHTHDSNVTVNNQLEQTTHSNLEMGKEPSLLGFGSVRVL